MEKAEELTFKPVGEPLCEVELNELAVIRQKDLDKAMAEADPSLKPFLEAQVSS